MRLVPSFAVAALFLGAGCSGSGDASSSSSSSSGGSPKCTGDVDCSATPETPACDVASGACMKRPDPAPDAGSGGSGGSGLSAALELVYESSASIEPTDLGFNPDQPDQLWVIDRAQSYVVILSKAGTPEQSTDIRQDPDAKHFMNNPPAFDFGANSTFGTCGDNNNGGDKFMGPALFSSDLNVFGEFTPGGLGSHLDMLHSTPYCRGIAHVEANVYWVFNSYNKSLDKYDFHNDHGPGNEDHSDGEIYRYVKGKVLGVDDIPSHVFYNAEDKQLYIADTGHKRIVKLDTASGTIGASFSGQESIKARKYVDGATLAELVPPGTLEAPSGIELHGGRVYVTDNATSRFHAFDMQGKELATFDTGLPTASLAGFTFGSDGKIYLVDLVDARVYRMNDFAAK